MRVASVTTLCLVVASIACQSGGAGAGSDPASSAAPALADVVGVAVSGNPGQYLFAVTISSPDAGCVAYADWWEVLSKDGRLRHRRILDHSHVAEQPFTRASGPVVVTGDEEVTVRAHMNDRGYGTRAMRGSARGGFVAVDLDVGFGEALVNQEPLPTDCAF